MASQQVRQNWTCHFEYEKQTMAIAGGKKMTEGKGWSGSSQLCFSFRGEF